MASTLSTPSYGSSVLGNLTGNGNSAQSTAANSIWQYGQYQPYTVNNPMGQTSFANGTATSSLSPLQSQLQTNLGNTVANNTSGTAATYNPNTTFLPSQYQSIFGGMQQNVNSQYTALQNAQQPFTQQYLQSNLDSEQAKGTLASTAGAYQTAGAQTAANAQSNANYAQAQTYALNTANSQFGAASSTAGLGEQQAEFGPQYAQSQTQGDFSDLLNQNQLSAQITGLGGSLGAQQSSANTTALMPTYGAAQTQDQAQSGLANSLLFGNGSGGLLGSLLGTSGGSSGALGSAGSGVASLLSSLFGGSSQLPTLQTSGASISGSAANTGSLGGGSISSPTVDTGDPGDGLDLQDSDISDLIGSFSSAGGQAANSGSEEEVNAPQSAEDVLDEVQGSGGLDSLNQGSALGSSSSMSDFGLNDIGAGAGIVSDLAAGTTSGDAKGALSATSLASNQGLFGSASSSIGSAASSGLSALGLVQGIQAGGVSGDLEAAASAAKLGATAGAATGALSAGAAGALSTAAGGILAPLAVYNAGQSFQPGNPGSDAVGGLEAGAQVGSLFGPVGTAIGGLIGAAGGAIVGALDAPDTPQQLASRSYTEGVGATAVNISSTTGQAGMKNANLDQQDANGSQYTAYKINGVNVPGSAISQYSNQGYNSGLRGTALTNYISQQVLTNYKV